MKNIIILKVFFLTVFCMFTMYSCQKQDDIVEEISPSIKLDFYEQYAADFNQGLNKNKIMIGTNTGAGVGYSYVRDYETANGEKYFWAIKVTKENSSGNIDWEYIVGFDSKGVEFGDIVVAPDGSIGLTGTIMTPEKCDERLNTDTCWTSDVFVAKISSSGSLMWKQNYDFNRIDRGQSLSCTSDGGFVVGGQTEVVSGNRIRGDEKAIILKINFEGIAQWHKKIERGYLVRSIIQTEDEGYIFTSETYDPYLNIIGLLIKVNKNGELDQKLDIGVDYSWAEDIVKANDNGYIVALICSANSSQVLNLVKLNETGSIDWKKGYTLSASDMKVVGNTEKIIHIDQDITGYAILYRKDRLTPVLPPFNPQYASHRFNNTGDLIK